MHSAHEHHMLSWHRLTAHQQPGSEAGFQEEPLRQDFMLRLRLVPGQRPQLRMELPVARRPPPLDSLSQATAHSLCSSSYRMWHSHP